MPTTEARVSLRTRRGNSIAGDGLLEPAGLVALAVLIVNDHVLKDAWPGLLTGKLSDFAGLLVFPLLLQAAWELAASRMGLFRSASVEVLQVAIVLTGLVFILVQLDAGVGDAYREFLGHAQAPLSLLGIQEAAPVALTQDPWDLTALVSLAGAWFVGRPRCTRTL